MTWTLKGELLGVLGAGDQEESMPSEDGGAWKERTDCFTPARSPGYVQGCRALMITAILLGFLGLFLGMVGLRCTNVGNIDLSRKAKILAIAGALHILAGNGGERGCVGGGGPHHSPCLLCPHLLLSGLASPSPWVGPCPLSLISPLSPPCLYSANL